MCCDLVRDEMGAWDGALTGATFGDAVGVVDRTTLGDAEGVVVGTILGDAVGVLDGCTLGYARGGLGEGGVRGGEGAWE